MRVSSTRVARQAQRLLAEALFTASSLRALGRPMAGLGAIAGVGATLHHLYGAPPDGAAPGWSESVFISVNLLFLEHLAVLPAHPIGQAVQYILPVFGVFLLAGGVLKLGHTIFDKQHHQERWMRTLAKTSRGHVILCGLGSVGYRVLEELVGMGEQVFAIEKEDSGPLLPQARALGVEVLIGDARAEHILRSLNVRSAKAVIVATDDDLSNLEIAMDVREIDSDVRIVMRLWDQRLAKKVQATLGIEVTLSTSRLAAPLFAAAALDSSVVGAHRVAGKPLVVMELRVAANGALDGATVSELVGAHRLTVIAAKTADSEEWGVQPSAATRLAAGDRVQVMVAGERVQAVHALNIPAERAGPST
jgi:voltage-gated potassium channel